GAGWVSGRAAGGRAGPPQRVKRTDLGWLQLCNGRRSLRQIQLDAMALAGGELLPLDGFSSVLEQLDAARFLDSERLRAYLTGRGRDPVCAGPFGRYSDDPGELRKERD